MFEWYDFYLAATAAAAVWPRIFFPTTMDPALALAVSVASVGLAYLARPIGAIIFGHLGDKYGRRNTLTWTLVVMGISCVGTAILPTYASIGMMAIVMIFILRFLVGLGLGGESGGAFSWIAEARPNSKHRGFWISWPYAVLTIGKLVSILAFYLAATLLPTYAAYLDWGWRVPFAVGAVMLVIGMVIRLKILESPMFEQMRSKRTILKFPAFQVIKEQWRKILALLWLQAYSTAIASLIILPYSVSYLVKLGVGEAFANLSVTGGTAAAFIAALGGAYVSDYVGRRQMVVVSALLCIAILYPYFYLLNTLNWIWIVIAQVILYFCSVLAGGVNSAIYTETFDTKYRYSGSGLTFQMSSVVAGLLIAFLLPGLITSYGIVGAWQPLVWSCIILCILAIVSAYFAKETRGATLQ
jgi:MFS family permease